MILICRSKETQNDPTDSNWLEIQHTRVIPFIFTACTAAAAISRHDCANCEVNTYGQIPYIFAMTDQDIVVVNLEESKEALWREFHSHTTEMVVTKSGRKMFPKLSYQIKGLEEEQNYSLAIHIEPVDGQRYKFSNGEWTSSGRDEPDADSKKIWHEDAVMPGKHWMSSPIGFDRVKITNNASDKCASHIFLQSMHKYIPVLTIYKSPSNSQFLMPNQTTEVVKRCRIPFTEFIAVTAYQNQSIVALKIAHNPFAKGFREGSPKDRKRGSPEDEDSFSQVSSPQPSSSASGAKKQKLMSSRSSSPTPASTPATRSQPVTPKHQTPQNPQFVLPAQPLAHPHPASIFNPMMMPYSPLWFAQFAAAAAAAAANGFAPGFSLPTFPPARPAQFMSENGLCKEGVKEHVKP